MPLPNNIILTSQWIETIFGKETKDGIFDFVEKFNKLDLKIQRKPSYFLTWSVKIVL